jgi:hypothetical protein
MTLAIAVILLAVAVGVCLAVRDTMGYHSRVDVYEDRRGWLYFVTPQGIEDAPIKIGMCHRDPTEERLPELRTMSPYPLRILYKLPVSDRYEYEAKVHHILAEHRRHGEWFDRDATLAFIDHLKGAA